MTQDCLNAKMEFQLCILILCAVHVISFHQHDYKFIQERISLEWYNTDYGRDAKIDFYHYTRYEKRINASVFVLQDLGHDITQIVQAYKYQSNEYREFPVLYSGNSCDDYKFNKFGTAVVHYNTSFVGCPVKRGLVYATNVYFDESTFPPYAPRGKYMLESAMYLNKTILLARVKWYVTIEPTNPLELIIMG